jgi:hypothetical protein
MVGEEKVELMSVEGSWHSVGPAIADLHRSFKPDKTAPCYPPHPVPSWLFTGAVEVAMPGGPMWLHTHAMDHVGPFSIVKCALVERRPQAVMTPLSQTRYREVPTVIGGRLGASLHDAAIALRDMMPGAVTLGTLSNPVAHSGFMEFEGHCPYDSLAIDKVMSLLAHKPLNGRVLQTLMAEAASAVAVGGVGPAIGRYPGLAYTLQYNTVLYACLSRPDAAGSVRLAESIAAAAADGTAEARTVVSTGKPAPARTGPIGWAARLALGLIAGGGMLWLLRRWRGRAVPSGPVGYIEEIASKLMTKIIKGTITPDEKLKHDAYKACLDMFKGPEPKSLNRTLYEISIEDERFRDSAAWGFLTKPAHYVGTAIEEGLKWLCPPVFGPLFAVGEALPWIQSGMPWRDLLAMRGTGTVLHLGTALAYSFYGKKAIVPALLVHWAHNWAVTYAFWKGWMGAGALAWNEELFAIWRLCWSHGLDSLEEGVVEAMFRFRAFRATTEFQQYMQDWRSSLFTIDWCGKSMTPATWTASEVETWRDVLSIGYCACDHAPVVGEECASCTTAPASSFSYPLLATSGMLYQPERDPWSTIVATASRDFVDPYAFYDSPTCEAASMGVIAYRLQGAIALLTDIVRRVAPLLPLATRQECAQAMRGAKGLAFTAAWLESDAMGMTHRTTVQVKYNETVKAARLNPMGQVELKPRSVKNVHTSMQTHILPVSRMLAKTLKEVFDGETVFDIAGVLVRIAIAHATPENMVRYAKLLQGDDMFILISCDDTVVSAGRYTAVLGFAGQETDYGSFDQSQSGPFWDGDEEILSPIWDLPTWWKLHDDINCAAVVANVSSGPGPDAPHMRLRAAIRRCMRTGVGTTSDLGSLHNIQSHVKWIIGGITVPFEKSCDELGLVAKVVYHQKTNGMTFLKGFFWDGTWNVLPSACLKLGKIMRDPVTLTGLPDAHVAASVMFQAVMAGVDVPPDYPLLGVFRSMSLQLNRAGGVSGRALAALSDPVVSEDARFKMRHARAPRSAVLEFISERYGLSANEIIAAERLVSTVSSLPALVVHPVFDRLKAVDYV